MDQFLAPQLASKQGTEIDIDAALQKAIKDPILFPPLNESVFAGDKVAIVIQSNLPHPRKVLESIVRQLAQLDIASTDVCVVVTPLTADKLGLNTDDYLLPPETKGDKPPPVFSVDFGFQKIDFQVHDPENSAGLSCLAANDAGEPVYMNRLLVDADFVITIGSPLPGTKSNEHPDYIYPTFSGTAAQARFASDDSSVLELQLESQLANDMLGSFFVLLLVCGPGQIPTEVIAGVRKQAGDQARLATNENWEFAFDGSASIVLATIESEANSQSWDNFADAVIFANQFVSGDGPMVVWSNIQASPNKFLRRACNDQFEAGETATKLPERYRQLAGIVSERPVFLRSMLTRSATENLGLGYLETVEEVLRISAGTENGLLIRDAHRCQIAGDSKGSA